MRKRFLVLLALLLLVVGVLPQAIQAQDPEIHRAPRPEAQGEAAPALSSPRAVDWGGAWQFGPDTGFGWYRHDCVYFDSGAAAAYDQKVYCLGGRPGQVHEPDVWMFDPVTGTWSDTHADMPVLASNYTASIVSDTVGLGIYMVAGYLVATDEGTDAVQVYYPATNTAVEVTTDPFPGLVQGEIPIAGGQEVVDNMIYYFGGWSSDAPGHPYTSVETWVYDPMAAAGTRWSQVVTADMNLGRGYIITAQVDGVIYAIGGDTYDGANLIADPIVEALDTADLAAGWDDAGVADMPLGCDEARAIGFDTSERWIDPDGTPLGAKIVTVGCGQWTEQLAESMVYDTVADSWDQTFPDLNTARRNFGATFIPDLGVPGTPGIWAFGGLSGAIVTTSEYYEVSCCRCNILLVDDDWDFDGTVPNDGGRPYYTSTLDALGYGYDLWDTDSMGTPPSTTMSAYDTVIWFTGYDWETPIDPSEEGELIAFLDNGGNLFMSSEDQEYAFPGSTIVTDYFWVFSFTEDVSLTEIVGSPGDPYYDGLGPYAMGRPDVWAPYWPTGIDEGPYDDDVFVKAGGLQPMLYTANGHPNSTRYQGSNFKTVYLGYPFEWITDLGDRADVLGTALHWFCGQDDGTVRLAPPSQTQNSSPGATVPFTVSIISKLGWVESFSLTYDALWPTTGPDSITAVPNGVGKPFRVEVTVPGDATCYDSDVVAIQATAWSNPLITASASLETSVMPTGQGGVEGTVYNANTGLPIENVYIYFGLDMGDDDYDEYETYTTISGTYAIPNVSACTFPAEFYAVGYYGAHEDLAINAGMTTTFDVYLEASMPELTPPDGFEMRLSPDDVATTTLEIANDGLGDLTFHISEIPSDAIFAPPAPVLSMPSGVDPQVFSDLAASTDGTAKFIVYMAEQADLSAAFSIKDYSIRGRYVYNALRSTAQRSQAGLRAELDRSGLSYESRYIVNALVVEGSLDTVNSIAARPGVAFIGPNTAIPAPEPVEKGASDNGIEAIGWNVSLVNADQVWSTYGATGAGIVVSNIDTGLDYDHPALVNQYRGNMGGGVFDHNYNWWDPYGWSPIEPADWHDHGSHTAGTMAGSDLPSDPLNAPNAIGLAPNAQVIACMGFDPVTGHGYNAELLECAEFLLAPWDLTGANPDPDLRANVINNSWGGGQAQWWYNQVIYAWHAAGTMGVFSAGNEGPACRTMGDPGDMYMIIAVGATDINDNIASFSSRGPANVTDLTKPNISAPGVNIRSAYRDGTFGPMGGTSMAAPHVSGAAALLWSAQPDLMGDVQLTYWILEQSAMPITTTEGCGGDTIYDVPNNTFGWGRLDIFAAAQMAISNTWDIAWLDVDPVSGVVGPDGTADVTLTFDTAGLTAFECYTGTLKIEFNDPYAMEVFMPVELCIGFQIYLPIVLKGA